MLIATHSSLSSKLRRSGPLSLTPCFSWVQRGSERLGTVSTVSTVCTKPLKRFFVWRNCHTQLKQGVNGMHMPNLAPLPKLARASQSRAGGHNPFGIGKLGKNARR